MNKKKVYLYSKRILIISFIFWFVIFFIPHCFRWCGETILDSSFAYQEYCWDYKMKESDILGTLARAEIAPNLGIYNLKGMKGPPDFHGDDFLKISFTFRDKNIHTLTNKLVNAWKNNKKLWGFGWNESSKWDAIHETTDINVANKDIIKLTIPKGSLSYSYNNGCAVFGIIINTNNMECLFSETKY